MKCKENGFACKRQKEIIKKRMRLFRVSLIGHDELVYTKNSRRYKLAVLSKEQNNPILEQKLVYLRKQTTTSPVIDPFTASFSKSFCGTASSCVFSTPEKIEKNVELQKKLSNLKKINDPT